MLNINEANYPQEFSLNTFKTLDYFKDRINYCEKYLSRIGAGSSRMVFKIDDNTCLKIAINKKGLVQNLTESDKNLQTMDLFTKVYDFDEDGMWIEAELAKRAKPSDFKRLTGYDYETMKQWINYCHKSYSLSMWAVRIPDNYMELFNSKEWEDNYEYGIFADIRKYMQDYMIDAIGDLRRISSWGIVNRNNKEQLVIIDSGLSDEIYNDYYTKKR